MSEKLTKEKLAELQRMDLPVMTVDDLGKIKIGPERDTAVEIEGEMIAILNEYLSSFVKPNGDGKCVNCGHVLTGLFGVFEYGIVHGEGHCSVCNYLARRDHYVMSEDREVVRILDRILQYHPSFLRITGLDRREANNGG